MLKYVVTYSNLYKYKLLMKGNRAHIIGKVAMPTNVLNCINMKKMVELEFFTKSMKL